MINHYELKKYGNEEVLILYLDLDVEFALDFRNNNKYKEFENQLKKIIDIEKFLGKKIILVVGGIVIGSLLFLGNINDNKDNLANYVFVDHNIIAYSNIDSNIENLIVEDTNNENKIEDINKDIIELVKEEANKEKEEDKVNTNNPETNDTNEDKIINDNQNITNQNSSKEEVQKEITIYRSNGSIINLSMNEYLIGVVAAEMPASFHIEALKAQAILARTYASKKIERNEKLTDTVSTQRYKDNSELETMWGGDYNKYYTKIKQAVEDTDGITLKYNGTYIEAVYHSTSNGKTEDAINVWGNSVPYLKSVDSSWDKNTTTYLRTENKELNNILDILGITSNDISFEIISRNISGRVEIIKIGNTTMSGVEFRTLLGLRSTDFDINLVDNQVVITTRGYGHGVGMSQYGANEMAKSGYSYSQILSHYYSGTYESRN